MFVSRVIIVVCGLAFLPIVLGGCSALRARREWRMLSTDERASWIAGVKCLASIYHKRLSFTANGDTISRAHSLYDDFAIAHSEMDKTAHKNSHFLLWHRWFLYLFDSRLRDTCGYNGPTPFWDWSQDVADLFASPVFDPDPVHGLGGSGDCTFSDCLITTGAFSPTPVLNFPVPHTLRRNLALHFPDENPDHPRLPHNTTLAPPHIERALARSTPGNFSLFQRAMEGIHDHVHNFVGGDLSGTCPLDFKNLVGPNCTHGFTPNDPLFWLHHAQLDRLWSMWQDRHQDNYYAFNEGSSWSLTAQNPSGESTAPILQFDRLSVDIPIHRVFNHSAPPLCYYYYQDHEETERGRE